MIEASWLENSAIYALTGAFAGIMSGILGIGGGLIVVPTLAYILHHNHLVPASLEMRVAAGTSLAIMIFTAQATVRAHQRQGDILWDIYHHLWPAMLTGTILGAILADHLTTYWLKLILGVFLLLLGVKMLSHATVTHPPHTPSPWVNRLVNLAIGLQSSLLGIGGGALVIPYLTYCGIEPRKIPAVAALCTLTVAMIGTLAFIITGSNEPGLPTGSSGYVYWPAVFWVAIPSMLFAPMGAHMTYVLPIKQLKYGFSIVLLLAALDLLF